MKKLIGMSLLAAMVIVPGCATTAQAGASVSVSVGIGSGYSTYYDEDLDWNNMIVIDNSTVGFWVMLPSGQWVFRCRSMWWNADYDNWCFGPWYYNYSIAYRCHCHSHYHGYCPFHAVRFHAYMHTNYRPWHERHFASHQGYYVQRYRSHEEYRRNHPSTVVIRENNRGHGTREKTTVIVREKEPVRIDGGTRQQRVEPRRSAPVNERRMEPRMSQGTERRGAEMTRSRTVTRESGNRSTTITRTETRRDGRRR